MKIKTCPFCGTKAEIAKDNTLDVSLYSVQCNTNDCYMHMGIGKYGYITKNDAIKIWNKRYVINKGC